MKRIFTLLFILGALNSKAQTWSAVGFPGNMVYQADTLNHKLYIATGGTGLQEYDGTSWNWVKTLSSDPLGSTGSKCSVKNINNLLFTGAKDFSTNGENDVHTFNGSTFDLYQNSDFAYNGSYRIKEFILYNGYVYAGGQFRSPDNASANLAKWNGNDWVGVGTNSLNYMGNQNNIVNRLVVYQNKLVVATSGKTLIYDGTSWDSLAFATGYYMAGVEDAAVFNSELYLCGSLLSYGSLAKWDGTTLKSVTNPYYSIRRFFVDGTELYAIAQIAYQGDVYIVKYDGTSWTNVVYLQKGNEGYITGFPLPDYNILFKYNNEMYVGGRFTEIGDTAIQSLAKITLQANVSDLNAADLQVSPNPCTSKVHLSGLISGTTIELIDIVGKMVISKTTTESNALIELNDLPAGIYTLKVGSKNQVITKKLIIQSN